MLTISKQADYGLLLLSLLDKHNLTPLSQLIEKTKLPRHFLARIAAQLVKNEIIESKEGKMGGYRLISKINKVSLYDYLKIFEGELNLVDCGNKEFRCRWINFCHHKSLLQKRLKKIVVNDLKKWKLVDFL